IEWPAEFASMSGFDAAQVVKAEAVEEAQFGAHAASVSAQKSVLRQRSSEMSEAARGYGSQMVAARRQQALLGQELAGLKSLAAQGYAPLNKVRELERTQAEIGGQRGQYLASADQARQQAQENDLEILQVDKTEADKIADQLHDVETSLADALPKLAAAKDRLARAEVRAPVSGTVVGLSVFTVGGVIAPGQPLMDIVPDKAPLLIEARVSPGDAEDLHSGQTVEIRFSALHDRRLPIITGRLTTISADSLTDKRTGKGYFSAQISVPVAQIDKLEKRRNADFALRPGLPVQVMVPLRKRTALGYILGPLGDTLWRSFRES
ncbi:MAG: HlyD family type I secretion periplasmic adaptor subunit, partial [Caulobacteraceae bacterium]